MGEMSVRSLDYGR